MIYLGCALGGQNVEWPRIATVFCPTVSFRSGLGSLFPLFILLCI